MSSQRCLFLLLTAASGLLCSCALIVDNVADSREVIAPVPSEPYRPRPPVQQQAAPAPDIRPVSPEEQFAALATSLPPGADTGPGTGLALIIGINKYEQMGNLDNCRQDAVVLANLLVRRGGYRPGRVLLMTDAGGKIEGRASYAALTRRIEQVCKLAKPDDVLFVYFAGHGITINGQGYLVPMDGGETRTSIHVTWLQDQIRTSQARAKFLVMDACHSGTAVRGVEGIVPSLMGRDGLVTMTSCADAELSYPNGEHGVFTEHLLTGLTGAADKNKDSKITNLELFHYVQAQMEAWSLKTGKTQRPQMFPPTGTDVPLCTVPKNQGGVAP